MKSMSTKMLWNITDNMINILKTFQSFRVILNINLITQNIR